MKGLLLKDWYILQNKGKFYLLIVPLYLIFAFISENLLFVYFTAVFMAMIPRTLAAYDEHSRWQLYTAVLPFTKKQLVKSRYLLSLLLVLVFSLLLLLLQLLFPLTGLTGPLGLIGVISTVLGYLSISFPLLYRFGSEKGRTIQTVLMMFFMVWAGVFSALVAAVAGSVKALHLLEQVPPLSAVLGIILLLFSFTLLYFSYCLSVKWYRYISPV